MADAHAASGEARPDGIHAPHAALVSTGVTALAGLLDRLGHRAVNRLFDLLCQPAAKALTEDRQVVQPFQALQLVAHAVELGLLSLFTVLAAITRAAADAEHECLGFRAGLRPAVCIAALAAITPFIAGIELSVDVGLGGGGFIPDDGVEQFLEPLTVHHHLDGGVCVIVRAGVAPMLLYHVFLASLPAPGELQALRVTAA